MRRVPAILCFIVAMSVSLPAWARDFRVQQTPGGPDFGCELCHLDAGGLNDFGFEAFEYLDSPDGNLDWSELAALDSDGDGYSNGLELGDPNGTWSIGDAYPSGTRTHPSDPDDSFCGNGTLEGPEECDGTNVNGFTCTSLALGDGTLGCTDRCVFDTSQCGECGDSKIQTDREECDGTNLGDATCEALGYVGGTLSCTATCGLDTSGCEGNPDGTIDVPDTCGNNIADEGEACDGFDLGGATCISLGYDGGTLDCNAKCQHDVSGCDGATSPDPQPETKTDAGNTDRKQKPSRDTHLIRMEGRACSVAAGETGAAAPLLLFLLGMMLTRRRRD